MRILQLLCRGMPPAPFFLDFLFKSLFFRTTLTELGAKIVVVAPSFRCRVATRQSATRTARTSAAVSGDTVGEIVSIVGVQSASTMLRNSQGCWSFAKKYSEMSQLCKEMLKHVSILQINRCVGVIVLIVMSSLYQVVVSWREARSSICRLVTGSGSGAGAKY